jgi:hypothetical protein
MEEHPVEDDLMLRFVVVCEPEKAMVSGGTGGSGEHKRAG